MKRLALRRLWSACISSVLLLTIAACDPTAGHVLSTEEKIADMHWIFTIFRNNYAPLTLKEKLNDFQFEQLKKRYLARAKATKNNEEFYQLMFRFVGEFTDAHTAGSVIPNSLPGSARVAYLGFSGVRDGDAMRVTKIMPTIDAEKFPIKVGDKVTHIGNTPILEYIQKNLVPYRSLGDEMANNTFHMGTVFARMSLNYPIPKEDTVTLKFTRPLVDNDEIPKNRKVTLPWIKKDLYDFNLEKATAEAIAKKSKTLTLTDRKSGQTMELTLVDHRGKEISISEIFDAYKNRNRVDFLNSFHLQGPMAVKLNPVAAAAPKVETEAPKTAFQKLKEERYVPENAISIEEAKTFPAYLYTADVLDDNSKVRGKKTIGYIRIESFSPGGDEKTVVAELKATLKKLEANGAKNLIIDTIDNPGGSLSLLAQVTQAFSNKKVKLADMQFGLNDQWLNQLQQQSLQGSDHEREHFRKLYEKLLAEKNEGKRLSKPYSMEEIIPFSVEPNYELDMKKIVLLTDEMCASCGDIFPAMMQDNGIAIIAGRKTMGAGGNVVDHMFDQSPAAKFSVRQTESLIVRKDGTYIENAGVTPDVEIDTNKSLASKYQDTLNEAQKLLLDDTKTVKSLAAARLEKAQFNTHCQVKYYDLTTVRP